MPAPGSPPAPLARRHRRSAGGIGARDARARLARVRRLARGVLILALGLALRAEAAPQAARGVRRRARAVPRPSPRRRRASSYRSRSPAPPSAREGARLGPRGRPLPGARRGARGAGGPEGKQLATVWTLAGQNEEAAEAWRAYAAAASEERERTAALAEAQRLGAAPDPFADKLTARSSPPRPSRCSPWAGLRSPASCTATPSFTTTWGMRSHRTYPASFESLDRRYDKLGAPVPRREFYRRYLVQRPFGANADIVRAELAKEQALGTLAVSSSLPCTEVWVNRQRLPKLPDKDSRRRAGSIQGTLLQPQVRDGAVRGTRPSRPASPRPWRSGGRSSRTSSSGRSAGSRSRTPRRPAC